MFVFIVSVCVCVGECFGLASDWTIYNTMQQNTFNSLLCILYINYVTDFNMQQFM